jgi:catechol 2,3-dioxygenase-like lactoylglutathione lyase family enzyme
VSFPVAGIHHITFTVTDLDRTRAFFEGVLGFEVDQHWDTKLRIRVGPYTRVVFVPPLPGTPDGDRFDERRIGLDHISVGVPSRADLDRLVEVLRAAGVATRGVVADALGPGVVSFRDPDNIAWEFFEQSPSPA